MEQQFGIEKTKQLIHLGCAIPKQIATALEDGKITLPEYFGFTDEALELIKVARSFKDVMNEVGELSTGEKDELKAYVVEQFDIPNDEAEAFYEDAIMWVFTTVSLVKRFGGLKNK
jgi:hypothetical protein